MRRDGLAVFFFVREIKQFYVISPGRLGRRGGDGGRGGYETLALAAAAAPGS